MAARREGWPSLFAAAFSQSRNPMSLVDGERRLLEVNGAYLKLLGHPREAVIGRPLWTFVVNGPLRTPAEWAAELSDGRASGTAELMTADRRVVGVQWAATSEVVTGRQLVLFVALSTSRWGHQFRRAEDAGGRRAGGELTVREREVVGLVAVGATAAEIAEDLHISHHTVRTHLRNAMEKLGARSRAHLVAKAIGHGLVLEGAAGIPPARYGKAAGAPPG